jgi:hypothetical protein
VDFVDPVKEQERLRKMKELRLHPKKIGTGPVKERDKFVALDKTRVNPGRQARTDFAFRTKNARN